MHPYYYFSMSIVGEGVCPRLEGVVSGDSVRGLMSVQLKYWLVWGQGQPQSVETTLPAVKPLAPDILCISGEVESPLGGGGGLSPNLPQTFWHMSWPNAGNSRLTFGVRLSAPNSVMYRMGHPMRLRSV